MTHPNTYILRLLRSQAHQLAHEVNLVPADAVLWKPEPAECVREQEPGEEPSRERGEDQPIAS